MKIIVVGTPKTGNTWVKHLLADLYNLPVVTLKPEFDADEAAAAGPNWISHQHYLPKQALLTWAKANGVIFITAIRHPADVLISLWHHIQKRKGKNAEIKQAASILGQTGDIGSDTTLSFVENDFHVYLNLSIAWLQVPGAIALRYEDLWTQPLETLARLTDTIEPRSLESLKLSLCACELGLMQQLLDPEKKLIRRGGTGGWREILPEKIKEALARLDPYPAQFAALSYSMDESDPANAPQPNPGKVDGPFSAKRHFDDGTPITPVLMKAYFDLPSDLRARWLAPDLTSAGSFYTWLNQPAAADPVKDRPNPIISELAYYIYRQRSDLQTIFRDPFGVDRSEFIAWFHLEAKKEYSLPSCFFEYGVPANFSFAHGRPLPRVLVRAYLDQPLKVRESWKDQLDKPEPSFISWIKAPAAADPFLGKVAPIITELGAYIHSIRADLKKNMPDLYRANRVDFSDWYISNASKEYGLDQSLIEPVIKSWAKGIKTNAYSFTDGTRFSRIFEKIYLALPESTRAHWPDPSQAGENSYLAWLKSPVKGDFTIDGGSPVITELGAYLYSIRDDLKKAMPDLHGAHRVDFAAWYISSAAIEYNLDRSLILPVVRSWSQFKKPVKRVKCQVT